MFDLISSAEILPPHLEGGVIAIGNFDGVHLGHQAVIKAAREIGVRERRPALALTFEPHPRQFFKPEYPVFRLSPWQDKALLFQAAYLQGAVFKDFDANLAAMSAQDFIVFLQTKLHAAHLVAGMDFHFGKGREGTPDMLKDKAAALGLQVTLIDAHNSTDGAPVSSSRIRAALSAGDMTEANSLLGYRWFVSGAVQHGDKRGRVLGFPTANIAMAEGFALKHGVYAARVFIEGAWYGAAVHFGTRMQFGGGAPLLEAHVLDFNGDVYGAVLHVEFIAFLRGEQKFDTVEGLIEQMSQDVSAARKEVSKAVTLKPSPIQARLETLLRHTAE